MNFLDLIIGLPILLMAISGFRNGLIKELASLAALLLGLFFAIYFSDVVAVWLAQYLDISERWLFIIAFIITFVVVVFLVSLIGNLLTRVASAAALGIINRLFGFLFGLLKGVVIMSALIMLFNMVDSKSSILRQEVKEGAFLWRPVERIMPYILLQIDAVDFEDPSWEDFKNNIRNKAEDAVNV